MIEKKYNYITDNESAYCLMGNYARGSNDNRSFIRYVEKFSGRTHAHAQTSDVEAVSFLSLPLPLPLPIVFYCFCFRFRFHSFHVYRFRFHKK